MEQLGNDEVVGRLLLVCSWCEVAGWTLECFSHEEASASVVQEEFEFEMQAALQCIPYADKLKNNRSLLGKACEWKLNCLLQ